MRIVSGAFRGRVLKAPKGMATRPTSDRVREAVFSSLESRYDAVRDASVLDMFAGSGALGLEAMSRGASSVTFVESARPARETLAANVSALGLGPRVSVDGRDAFRASRYALVGAPFSLLFLDPPYRIEPVQVRELLEALVSSGNLATGSVIVYEHRTGAAVEWPHGFEAVDDRGYGETTVSFAVWRSGRELTA